MTTDTQTRPAVGAWDPADLEGRTREQVLALCREAGLAATAWKRGRMVAVLTGAEPAPSPRARAVKITEPAERAPASADAAVYLAKVLEQRRSRTGPCQATTCRAACQAYEEGARDAFRWQLCSCGHTQWAHETGAKHA
jgi:hypothetical protein